MQMLEESERVPGFEFDGSAAAARKRALTTPRELWNAFPRGPLLAQQVDDYRDAVRGVLRGDDDRLVVVAGPCSIHDVDAGLAYAKSLSVLAGNLAEDLLVVMRVYVEKPRTTVGWPGLLVDPRVDGGGDVETGLREARRLMLEVAALGLPVATEWLHPAAPAFLSGLVSWGAVGARTVESQPHRQMASGLEMPIGMKNASSGSVQAAVDAIRTAAAPHTYFGVDADGRLSVLRSAGNPDCHVVLRGSSGKPNYGAEDVRAAAEKTSAAGLPGGVVVDASHGNSGKDHERQAHVVHEIAAQVAGGSEAIRGVMVESFLVAGRQDHRPGGNVFGQSITDACLGWEQTVELMNALAESVRARRAGSR